MKILLAEDEEQLSRVLVAAMQSVNYEVNPVLMDGMQLNLRGKIHMTLSS